MRKLISILVLFTLFSLGFSINTLGVSSISDDGAGNVTFTLDYSFDDSVCGIQFDLLTDNVVTLTGYSDGGAIEDAVYNPGHHSVNWNAAGYASGVYFVQMNTDGFSDTKKIMLLK